MVSILFLIVSFGASIAGAICGIGGGVLIKPLLDSFHVVSVATISFLSSCTVMTMSMISVIKARKGSESLLEMRISTPLGIGAAVGGLLGTQFFQVVSKSVGDNNQVGFIQAVCLMLITVGTFIYTIFSGKIKTWKVKNLAVCVFIGLALGLMSSFLGIGGGPINLVVLYFFFSMDTKTAAQNSIYIIMISQIAGLLRTVITGSVPEFQFRMLALMVLGGFFGGLCGSRINKTIRAKTVEKLFLILMLVIIGINIYNMLIFSGALA